MTPIAFKTSLSARPCFYDHSPVPVPCEMLPSRPHTLHKVPQTCAAPLCFGKLLLQPGLLFPPPAWAPHCTVTAPQLACLPYQAPGWLRSSLGTLIGICHLSWEESPSA